jgi:hypothetical protein
MPVHFSSENFGVIFRTRSQPRPGPKSAHNRASTSWQRVTRGLFSRSSGSLRSRTVRLDAATDGSFARDVARVQLPAVRSIGINPNSGNLNLNIDSTGSNDTSAEQPFAFRPRQQRSTATCRSCCLPSGCRLFPKGPGSPVACRTQSPIERSRLVLSDFKPANTLRTPNTPRSHSFAFQNWRDRSHKHSYTFRYHWDRSFGYIDAFRNGGDSSYKHIYAFHKQRETDLTAAEAQAVRQTRRDMSSIPTKSWSPYGTQTKALRCASNARTVFRPIAATVGFAAIVSCSTTANHHPRIPSTSVEVVGEGYEIITCRGANQSIVACPAGEERRFEGALVCKLAGRWSEPIPPELCAQLPNGCAPYVPPKSNLRDSSLPRDYVAALGTVLPNVRECGRARVAFSRVGTAPTPSNVAFGLKNELEKTIPNMKNVAVEVSGCCDKDANTRCANLFLHGDFALSPAALAQALAQSVKRVVAEDVGVTIVVQRFQKESRCSLLDPDCGPQLVGDGCLDEIHYDWGGPRRPLFGEFPEPGDECVHDGDCFTKRSDCLGWRSFVPRITLENSLRDSSSRHWGSAMCGCYNGRCTLIYQ